MTLEQIRLVQASFAKIAPIAGPAAALFYQRLFTLDPTLAALFTGDMCKQERKLMWMIGTAVNSLDQLDSIVPAVKALGARHAHYGVEDAHYAESVEGGFEMANKALPVVFADAHPAMRGLHIAADVIERAAMLAVQGDVSHLDDLDRLFSKVRLDQGRIDVLFANAGLGAREPLGKITESSSHRGTGLQTRGSGNSCRAKQGPQAQPAGAAVRLDNNREAFR